MGGLLLKFVIVVKGGGGGGSGGPNLAVGGGGGGGGDGAGEVETETEVCGWTAFVDGVDAIVTEDFFTFSGIVVTGFLLTCNGPSESIYKHMK